jgi:uncharacterized protein (DUF302 family)
MKTRLIAALIGTLAAPAALAADVTTHDFPGSFDDATFAVENAIIGQGLVIDYTSHVGDMLNRTAEDVGSDVEIYDAADIFIFCSATVSREVMEADPMNIAHCPYGIFVTDKDGDVEIGYRNMPDGEMQKVQALLDEIVQEALP